MNDLKPCPFCGGEAKWRKYEFLNVASFYVECVDCDASSNRFDHLDEAVEAWNRRAHE